MEARAIAKYVRMSPIKLKPVCDLVRGKDLNEADIDYALWFHFT